MADMANRVLTRPDLTMPPDEAAALREAYAQARVILEYGSGGSTLLAAEMPGKRVFSVESDKNWVSRMQTWLDAHPTASGTKVDIIWCDIGPTAKWGHPTDAAQYIKYAQYPLAVWDHADFEQPDVVLVDGRFRTGCALAAAYRSTSPVKVMIDDYMRRKHYHRVERFLGTPEMIGRMAAFHVEPRPVPPEALGQIIEMMTRP
ncbi:MAG: hypothetical protein AAF681_12935 [Pseudomonadota bacterium]